MLTFFENYIFQNFNYCLRNGEFPCVLKHADNESVHKKKIKSDKANCKPVSILPNLFKIYQKLMYHIFHQNNVNFEKVIALSIV